MKPWHTRRALWAALLAVASVTGAQAADLSISQFRVRGPAGGNDEFIELFNGGRQALDLSGYKLNASNASGTTGTRLTLVESGFDAVPAHRRDEAFRMNERGWTAQMDNIRAHVDG